MTIVLDQELKHLLDSPRLAFIARRIDAVLADEAQQRREFYAAITEGDKAEFINGEVIFHSPVKLRHNAVAKRLLILLDTFVMVHDLGYVGFEKIMVSLTRNDYEPDICYFNQDKAARFTPDQMRFPAPDLIVEVISASTEKIDRGVKFDDYAAHGVPEYWIIDPEAEVLEQYRLPENGDVYDLVIKAGTGLVSSFAVPGFEIPVRAIFDPAINQETLQTLIAR
ncbi:MAG: Uma2 family endonuclease [Anaerolineae bacterium]|nr:Uma2 family endonuclease [Anaerolineae bacterium]